MKRSAAFLGVVCLMVLWGCATAPVSTKVDEIASIDEHLRKLEISKWEASSIEQREAFLALFADEFVSVEYGSDVQGGVHRKTRAEVFSAPPLPPAKFELSEWRMLHVHPEVVIASYRVKGLTFPWEAYATSVWLKRGGRWQTVFYQATTITN